MRLYYVIIACHTRASPVYWCAALRIYEHVHSRRDFSFFFSAAAAAVPASAPSCPHGQIPTAFIHRNVCCVFRCSTKRMRILARRIVCGVHSDTRYATSLFAFNINRNIRFMLRQDRACSRCDYIYHYFVTFSGTDSHRVAHRGGVSHAPFADECECTMDGQPLRCWAR